MWLCRLIASGALALGIGHGRLANPAGRAVRLSAPPNVGLPCLSAAVLLIVLLVLRLVLFLLGLRDCCACRLAFASGAWGVRLCELFLAAAGLATGALLRLLFVLLLRLLVFALLVLLVAFLGLLVLLVLLCFLLGLLGAGRARAAALGRSRVGTSTN